MPAHSPPAPSIPARRRRRQGSDDVDGGPTPRATRARRHTPRPGWHRGPRRGLIIASTKATARTASAVHQAGCDASTGIGAGMTLADILARPLNSSSADAARTAGSRVGASEASSPGSHQQETRAIRRRRISFMASRPRRLFRPLWRVHEAFGGDDSKGVAISIVRGPAEPPSSGVPSGDRSMRLAATGPPDPAVAPLCPRRRRRSPPAACRATSCPATSAWS